MTIVTLIVTFLIASMLFNLYLFKLLFSRRGAANAEAIDKAAKAMRDYITECEAFDFAVPPHAENMTAPHKPTLQEQINQQLAERISALETYRKQHAVRLNDMEDQFAATGDEIDLDVTLSMQSYAVASGHLDDHSELTRFDVRDVTDSEARMLIAMTKAIDPLAAEEAGIVDPRGNTIVTTHELADASRDAFSNRPHALADSIFGVMDEFEDTQPIYGPNIMVDHFLSALMVDHSAAEMEIAPRAWSNGDQTVVDVQAEVRDGWAN